MARSARVGLERPDPWSMTLARSGVAREVHHEPAAGKAEK